MTQDYTPLTILITQIPIAIAIAFLAYELHKTRNSLVGLLRKLSEKK